MADKSRFRPELTEAEILEIDAVLDNTSPGNTMENNYSTRACWI